ncbi:MAG TPA: signal recognition particle-docking protein FtsY [Candidatus Saccharimonadales bacterium]|nr:signal recognition particle-docking protein FtsY [Candidatus Saccharimonadales bacterium]
MFQFIKEKLQKIYSGITKQLQSIFEQKSIDQSTIAQIQELLIKADTGVAPTKKIIDHLQSAYENGTLQEGSDARKIIHQELTQLLSQNNPCPSPTIFLLVGINGSGKTTFAGKLANFLVKQKKSCLIAAADTFRAAAPQQLTIWAQKAGASLIVGKPNQDPASVTFDACEEFKDKNFDTLIIDTAGRLQTKEHLMKELEKIKRIIAKQLPNQTICTLLTVDSMLGQNSFHQAQIFNEATKLDGIILTKIDGSAKGGIVFSIVQELHIPIAYLSWGEHIDDMTPFDPELYIQNLLGEIKFQSHKHQ